MSGHPKNEFPELGIYLLPGHVNDPRPIFQEVDNSDALGLGSVWISERLNTKELGALSGVAAARTRRMGIAAGLIANLPLRNPLVTAAYASTMMTLSDHRFALGLGRGADFLADVSGTPRLNFRLMEDYIGILRGLWRGEQIHYEGPLGRFKGLSLGLKLDPLPPIIAGVMGAKTSYWAGRHCDGVLLNSLWSTAAVAESVRWIRQGASDAGRDPAGVKIWTILMTACDVPEDVMLQTIIRRMNTYVHFPPMFNAICDANHWDRSVVDRVRQALKQVDVGARAGNLGDEATSRDLDALRRVRELYPEQWIQESCAVGDAAHCAQRLADCFAAGVDGVLFHGTAPDHLGTLLPAWQARRPAQRFAGRSVNPGL